MQIETPLHPLPPTEIRPIRGTNRQFRLQVPPGVCKAYNLRQYHTVTWWLRADAELWLATTHPAGEPPHTPNEGGLRLWQFPFKVAKGGEGLCLTLPTFIRRALQLSNDDFIEFEPWCCHLVHLVPIRRVVLDAAIQLPLLKLEHPL